MDWFLLAGLVAGPGTWISLILRGRRAAGRLLGMAGLLNLYGTIGGGALAFILQVFRSLQL
jgi:hypothetical protein